MISNLFAVISNKKKEMKKLNDTKTNISHSLAVAQTL